jgi:hypothetical protein
MCRVRLISLIIRVDVFSITPRTINMEQSTKHCSAQNVIRSIITYYRFGREFDEWLGHLVGGIHRWLSCILQ